jgi:hypothetical protein
MWEWVRASIGLLIFYVLAVLPLCIGWFTWFRPIAAGWKILPLLLLVPPGAVFSSWALYFSVAAPEGIPGASLLLALLALGARNVVRLYRRGRPSGLSYVDVGAIVVLPLSPYPLILLIGGL